MFQFPGLPSHRLCIHLWILKHYLKCVPAFGNLRIIGYLLLPAAYRSLSRPSSAPSAKASALCSFSLDLLLVFCSLHCVAARSFVGYIPMYAPSALPRAPCESCKILRKLHCLFTFLLCCSQSLWYSHTLVCSVPRSFGALHKSENPAQSSLSHSFQDKLFSNTHTSVMCGISLLLFYS